MAEVTYFVARPANRPSINAVRQLFRQCRNYLPERSISTERIEFIASPSLAINNGFCKTGRSLYASGRPAAP